MFIIEMNQNLVLEEFEEIISEHSLRHFRGWFSSEETRNWDLGKSGCQL